MQGTLFCQRWLRKRGHYRPAGEPIDTRHYEVAEIAQKEARAFVTAHHYAASYPADRFRFGLFKGARLSGVAVFSVPTSARVLTNVFPGLFNETTELGRFVLLDSVPANGETWMLARCRELLRARGIVGVVSFSDDQPRTTAAGAIIFPGHIGTIYQASNACYLGRATPRSLRLFPDGKVFSDRTIQKIRSLERGSAPAASLLTKWGASEPPMDLDARRAWLAFWLPVLTRPLSHPGNHKYAWSLDRSVRLPDSKEYPKFNQRSFQC